MINRRNITYEKAKRDENYQREKSVYTRHFFLDYTDMIRPVILIYTTCNDCSSSHIALVWENIGCVLLIDISINSHAPIKEDIKTMS